MAAPHWVGPVIGAVLIVLALVYVSYLQTLGAYPNGGGESYTVAKDNLGAKWGVVAATALCTDYVLNVAVAMPTLLRTPPGSVENDVRNDWRRLIKEPSSAA